MLYQSQQPNQHHCSEEHNYRETTYGKAFFSLREMKRNKGLLSQPKSKIPKSKDKAVNILYRMKKLDFIQESKNDDATIQILRKIPLSYQLDMIVNRFEKSDHSYPSPDVVLEIIRELENEGVFGPSCDAF